MSDNNFITIRKKCQVCDKFTGSKTNSCLGCRIRMRRLKLNISEYKKVFEDGVNRRGGKIGNHFEKND